MRPIHKHGIRPVKHSGVTPCFIIVIIPHFAQIHHRLCGFWALWILHPVALSLSRSAVRDERGFLGLLLNKGSHKGPRFSSLRAWHHNALAGPPLFFSVWLLDAAHLYSFLHSALTDVVPKNRENKGSRTQTQSLSLSCSAATRLFIRRRCIPAWLFVRDIYIGFITSVP